MIRIVSATGKYANPEWQRWFKKQIKELNIRNRKSRTRRTTRAGKK